MVVGLLSVDLLTTHWPNGTASGPSQPAEQSAAVELRGSRRAEASAGATGESEAHLLAQRLLVGALNSNPLVYLGCAHRCCRKGPRSGSG